jgi:hypothetical protein
MPGNRKQKSPPVADFPSGRFPLRGSLSALQPEAPTRGFEPNCGACFGQRLLSSVIPQKPHAASPRPRHHGKGPHAICFSVWTKGFSLSRTRRHSAPFQLAPRLANPAIGSTSAPQILPLHPLHPPASTARSARLHYPSQSRRGNLQPSLARPKRTAQESRPRRPTRADVLAWDLDWDWVEGRGKGRREGRTQPGRSPDMLTQANLPPSRPPASTLSHACEMSAGFRR